MQNLLKYSFIIIIFAFPFGCATVISQEIKSRTNPSLSFLDIARDAGSHKGRTVVWGGEIIECVNKQDGTSLLEVYQKPLDLNDAPDLSSESEGRFLIKSDKFLDPYAYRKGRKITVGGEILGEEIRQIGEVGYRYPVVLSKEIYLWRDTYFYDTPYPFYDPWWGYPYRSYPYYRHRHHR
ncbi:MAG: Slp family lipoprotein [Spirochaetota bacterium]